MDWFIREPPETAFRSWFEGGGSTFGGVGFMVALLVGVFIFLNLARLIAVEPASFQLPLDVQPHIKRRQHQRIPAFTGMGEVKGRIGRRPGHVAIILFPGRAMQFGR